MWERNSELVGADEEFPIAHSSLKRLFISASANKRKEVAEENDRRE